MTKAFVGLHAGPDSFLGLNTTLTYVMYQVKFLKNPKNTHLGLYISYISQRALCAHPPLPSTRNLYAACNRVKPKITIMTQHFQEMVSGG